jgi:hypothetical protein
MNLGAFSISVTVKNIAASRAFSEKLGFQQVGGDPAQNRLRKEKAWQRNDWQKNKRQRNGEKTTS